MFLIGTQICTIDALKYNLNHCDTTKKVSVPVSILLLLLREAMTLTEGNLVWDDQLIIHYYTIAVTFITTTTLYLPQERSQYIRLITLL